MEFLTAGLVTTDAAGNYIPKVAEAVPTVENGLWKVFPDGRMETTYKVREGFTWHDGTALTAADYVFSLQVRMNPDSGRLYSSTFKDNVESVVAPDARTVTVTSPRPYIWADGFFVTATTFPRHLLAEAFQANPTELVNLPYFTSEYVSNGPYTLEQFDPSTQATLRAYDPYPLGRPKIDTIQIKFIPDSNALLANVLSDELDILLGARHLGYDQGLEARRRWANGTVTFGANGWSVIHPQMFYSDPETVQNAQFRRAMFMAVDRQAMSEEFQGGLTSVAHSIFEPYNPLYEPTLHRVVEHPYDPRRSEQMLDGLGFRAGSDGFRVKPNRERIQMEIRTTQDIENTVKQMFAIADGWNQIKVATTPQPIPNQVQRDLEYRSRFCCFEVLQGGQGENGLLARRDGARRPPRWQPGHYSSYENPEHTAMINRYLATIPINERIQIAGDILHHLTGEALFLGMYWVARPTVVRKGLSGPVGLDTGNIWTFNSHQWDITR